MLSLQIPLLPRQQQVPSLLFGQRVPVHSQVLVDIEYFDGARPISQVVASGAGFVRIHAVALDESVGGWAVEAEHTEDALQVHPWMVAHVPVGFP